MFFYHRTGYCVDYNEKLSISRNRTLPTNQNQSFANLLILISR